MCSITFYLAISIVRVRRAIGLNQEEYERYPKDAEQKYFFLYISPINARKH